MFPLRLRRSFCYMTPIICLVFLVSLSIQTFAASYFTFGGDGSTNWYGLKISINGPNFSIQDTTGKVIFSGSTARADGLKLVPHDDRAVLESRGGHQLWAGPIWQVPDFTIDLGEISSSNVPRTALVKDRSGRVVWSGKVSSRSRYGQGILRFDAGVVHLQGEGGRDLWTGQYGTAGILLRDQDTPSPFPITGGLSNNTFPFSDHGWRIMILGVTGGGLLPLNYVARFSYRHGKAVVRDQNHHTLWEGAVTPLLLSYKSEHKDEWGEGRCLYQSRVLLPTPSREGEYYNYTLFDTTGQVLSMDNTHLASAS